MHSISHVFSQGFACNKWIVVGSGIEEIVEILLYIVNFLHSTKIHGACTSLLIYIFWLMLRLWKSCMRRRWESWPRCMKEWPALRMEFPRSLLKASQVLRKLAGDPLKDLTRRSLHQLDKGIVILVGQFTVFIFNPSWKENSRVDNLTTWLTGHPGLMGMLNALRTSSLFSRLSWIKSKIMPLLGLFWNLWIRMMFQTTTMSLNIQWVSQILRLM